MKTIGIDCRLAGEKHAGIGRYIEELVVRVTKDMSINWVLFFHEVDQIYLPKQTNIKIVIAPIRHYSLAEQIRMPGIFLREHLDLLHVPHYNVPLFYPKKYVVTIHDLLWHEKSNSDATTLSPIQHALKYQAYKRVVRHAVFWAEKIIVPAQKVKADVHRIFPHIVRLDKVVVTYEGANNKFQNSNFKIQNKLQANSSKLKALFYTGSLYPHKNLMLVVHALRKLPEYELYISSSRSAFVEEFLLKVSSMSVADRVHHLGRLTDEELLAWYHKSAALVQPSTSEGFGLTGIEAMAAGLPVLASTAQIFKEIYGDAFIGFDPRDVDSFIGAVHALETSDRNELIRRGQLQAKKYSWDTMAQQTKDIYLSCL